MQAKEIQIAILPDGRMNTANAAAYLGKSQKTLAMMRCEGTGPKFLKVGGTIFYFKKDLDEWILKDGKRLSTGKLRRKNDKDAA